MDLVYTVANLKSYHDTKINYLQDFIIKSEDYAVWEYKNENQLADVANLDVVSFVKGQRKWKSRAISALDKLIKSILKVLSSQRNQLLDQKRRGPEESPLEQSSFR